MRQTLPTAVPGPRAPGDDRAVWPRVLAGLLVVGAGVLAGLLTGGTWPRPLLVGGGVVALAAAGGGIALWSTARRARRIALLVVADRRVAEALGDRSARAAVAAAVEVLVPEARLVALHLGPLPGNVEGLTDVLVADALASGRPAVLPDGTTGGETARRVALPITATGRRIGAAVLWLPGPPVRGVQDLQDLLVSFGPALAATTATGIAGAAGPPEPLATPVSDGGTGIEGGAGEDDRRDAEGDAELRQLVARAAHDLRTPLNTLAGMVETLAEHNDALEPSSRAQLIDSLQRSTRRVAGWITSLLDAATAAEAVRPVAAVATRLQPLLEEAVVVSRAATTGLDVEVVPTDLGVMADRGSVVRVVGNLLVNAGHHARDGHGVEVEATAQADEVIVSVRDHGAGWHDDEGTDGAEERHQSNGHVSGLGLGLESVRAQVAGWAGRLELADTPGGGATVRFTLPRATAAAVAERAGRGDGDGDGSGWTMAGDEGLLGGHQPRRSRQPDGRSR